MDKIQVGEYSIDAEISREQSSGLNIVIAHGGNNDMHHSLIQKLFDAFVGRYSVLRFNFSFVNENHGAIGNLDKSIAELTACVKYIGTNNVVLIGKSYGGYVSTLLAGRSDLGIKKVVTLGYPLHKPGKPSEVRYGLTHTHLENAELPVEFIVGDSDHVWDIKKAPQILAKYKLDVIENADHSFKPVRPGSTVDENEDKAVNIVRNIVSEMDSGLTG